MPFLNIEVLWGKHLILISFFLMIRVFGLVQRQQLCFCCCLTESPHCVICYRFQPLVEEHQQVPAGKVVPPVCPDFPPD